MQGPGLEKLLLAGVQRGFWPQEYANKQHFLSDPVIVTPSTTFTELTEVRNLSARRSQANPCRVNTCKLHRGTSLVFFLHDLPRLEHRMLSVVEGGQLF